MLNIVVFIKQVPDTDDVKWTQNNNIDRTRMDSILNPLDKQAIQAALRLKETNEVNITAITMGPKKSLDVLKEAVAMGVDDAALLCDSKFAGSDTCATSKVLSAAIREKYPNTDLILFGQSAIDGETSQTGPSVAVRLNMPFIGNVYDIQELNDSSVIALANNENEKNTYRIKLPAVLCINNYIFEPKIPRINGYINAHKYRYQEYNIYELKLDETDTGVKGSPTYVSKVYKSNDYRDCKLINTEENNNYSYEVIEAIKEVMAH